MAFSISVDRKGRKAEDVQQYIPQLLLLSIAAHLDIPCSTGNISSLASPFPVVRRKVEGRCLLCHRRSWLIVGKGDAKARMDAKTFALKAPSRTWYALNREELCCLGPTSLALVIEAISAQDGASNSLLETCSAKCLARPEIWCFVRTMVPCGQHPALTKVADQSMTRHQNQVRLFLGFLLSATSFLVPPTQVASCVWVMTPHRRESAGNDVVGVAQWSS